MANRACPSCSEIIPSDVDYCPFCGNSTQAVVDFDGGTKQAEAFSSNTKLCFSCGKSVPADVDYCPFCGESTGFVVKTDAPPPTSDDAIAPKPPIVNAPYTCLMCHDFPATDGDYCADCREKLDRKPSEWQAEQVATTKRTIVIAAVIGLVLLIVGLVVFHHHGHARSASIALSNTMSHFDCCKAQAKWRNLS